MAKNYRNKEACLEEAKRLGIKGAEDMSWPTLQKMVSEGLKLEKMGVDMSKFNSGLDEMERKMIEGDPEEIEQHTFDLPDYPQPQLTEEQKRALPYMDKTIIVSPELQPERYRLLKYDEDLGPDYDVVERQFDIDRSTDQVYDISGELGERNAVDQYHDYLSGTYRLKKRSDRRVKAMSSVPKENSGMMMRWQDVATLVTWQGRVGYLWKHMWLPNVKDLLVQSGYYNEYKDLFKDEPNVWYAAGKQLVCDPYLVHRVLQEIEEKERRKAQEDRTIGWRW